MSGTIGGCFDGERRSQIERIEGEIVAVAAEIAHRAVAEIPPAIPLGPGHVDGVERSRRGGAEPQVPIETGRHRIGLFRALRDDDNVLVPHRRFAALNAPRAVHPHVHFAHGADRAALNQLLHTPVIVRGVALIAHLRRQFQL